MRRVWVGSLVAAAAALIIAGCGGSGVSPTPTPGGGGGGGGGNSQPPPNNLPDIDSIAIQGTRSKEPANFADVGEAVVVKATVRDDETPLDQLIYDWTATAGTFTGTGASVVWTAPSSSTEAADVTLTLKVTEKFGNPGGPLSFEHSVSKTAALSLHDSRKEVGEMARQFLLDFSDSNIRDIQQIMRNFQPGCYGTQAETNQVSDNRQKFVITASSVGQPEVTLNFDSIGPFRGQRGDAFARLVVHWESKVVAGGTDSVSGVDWVAAYYYSDQKRW